MKWPDRRYNALFDFVYIKFLEKTNCRNRMINGWLDLGVGGRIDCKIAGRW